MLEEPQQARQRRPGLQPLPPGVTRARSRKLWAVVLITDIVALLAGWVIPALVACIDGCTGDLLRAFWLTLAMVPLTMAFLALSDAYGGGAWMLYSVEVSRSNRAFFGCAAVFLLLDLSLGGETSPLEAAWRAALALVVLTSMRSLRRRWVSRHRRAGRLLTTVLLVGTGPESEELFHLFKDHPEIGYKVAGLVPSHSLVPAWSEGLPTFPLNRGCLPAARECEATMVLIEAPAFDEAELQAMVAELTAAGLRVRLAGRPDGWATGPRLGLKRVSLAYESIYDLVPSKPPPWQLAAKRAVDVVFGTVALLICLPVLFAAALAVRVFDGSPVLIRQQRVGRFGKPFTMLKLRTMVVNAEARLPEVLPMNMRDGPLFKADSDPRITPLGRFLRAASIDEIPQLLNVVRGDMSLVGPRPSLPEECLNFDGTLRLREQVPPGLSGLWQVEARDLPSFRAYRRLDLYYVHNWSLGLDLAILMVTLVVVAARATRAIGRVLPGRSRSSSLTLLD